MRAVVACAVSLPLIASADDKAADLSHDKQVELSARIALGLRGIATYDENVYCGETDSSQSTGLARVCTGRAPVAIAFEFGYGIRRAIDLIAELRIGIEQDFGSTPASDDGVRPLHFS